MAEKMDAREVVDIHDLVVSDIVTTKVLINILDAKELISKAEVMEEIKAVKGRILLQQCLYRKAQKKRQGHF